MTPPRKCFKRSRFVPVAACVLMCSLFLSVSLSVALAGPKGVARGNPHVNYNPHANPHSGNTLTVLDGLVNPAGIIIGTGGVRVSGTGLAGGQSVPPGIVNVTNGGTMAGPKGHILMAGGDTAILGQLGSNIFVDIGGLASNGSVIGVLKNRGKGHMSGGIMVLAAGDVFSTAIPNLDSMLASLTVPDPIGAKGPNPTHGGSHPNKGDGNSGGGNGNGHWGEGNQGNGVGNIWTGNQGHGVGEGMAGGRKPGPPEPPEPPEPPVDNGEVGLVAAPLPREPQLAMGGCPALMAWLAEELGVSAEEIYIYVPNALALNADLMPCEACAGLKNAAAILADSEGIYIAALTQVVTEFVTTPVPPSEEQMAAIAVALAEHVEDDTYYAQAGQWTDALVEYVDILNTGLGWSAADSVVFAMDKYAGPESDSALSFYIQARLAALMP